ncbi:hypothetical protein JVU11DRAFT_8707 [Chiua virens]|nr:hypothetical protein JVU11DRAFT_8707 [Chiua virens]
MISKYFVALLALGAIVPFAQATDPNPTVPFIWPTSESTLKRGKTYHAQWRTDNFPARFGEIAVLWLVEGNGTKVEPALAAGFYISDGGVDFNIPENFEDNWPKASLFLTYGTDKTFGPEFYIP